MIGHRFVEDNRAVYGVARLCDLVDVPRSSFYLWRRRPLSAREIADGELLVEIREIYVASRNTYGAPRVHGQLARRGWQVGCKRVARLMRQDGLVGAHWPRKKYKRGRPDLKTPAPDLLKRDFTADRPNRRWVADVTRFPTGEGPLFLAGIRDLCWHGIVGWSMGESEDTEIVVDALTMALGRCSPDPDGLVHHSDKGCGYTSLDFTTTADLAGLQISFGSTGDCFDNAAVEAFWSTLKREINWIRGSLYFETRDEARLYLFEFLEIFYNRQRHQAGLDHETPVEYLARYDTTSPDTTSPDPKGRGRAAPDPTRAAQAGPRQGPPLRCGPQAAAPAGRP